MNKDNKFSKVYGVLKSLIFSAVNRVSFAILMGFFLVVLLVLLFVCVLPVNQMFNDGSQTESVGSAISDSYDSAVVKKGSQIISDRLNDRYDCDGDRNDIYADGDGYIYETDACLITIHTSPEKNEITRNINAYTSAVDGTIALYYPEVTEKTEVVPDNELTTFGENGNVVLTDDGKKYLEHDEYGNASSSAYESNVRKYSESFFEIDSDSERWDYTNEYVEEKTEYAGCRLKGHLSSYVDSGISEGECSGEKIYEKSYIQHADVEIPVYYDLKNYKSSILDEAAADMVGQVKYEEVMQEDGNDEVEIITLDEVTARELLDETVENNYYSYFGGSEYEDRTVFFRKLIDTGYLTFIPIYGISLSELNGIDDGESGYVDSGISGSAIWSTITSLRNKSVLSKSNTVNYQCTSFAAYWFYKVYGYDALHGDGKYMADYLARENGNFILSSSPKAGGIFSIITSSHGHVGGIDAVDYESRTITISEGNMSTGKLAGTSKTAVVLKKTYTFDEFLNHVRNICQTQNSSVCSIKYASPI